jgi:galactose mutarotase-like enzyme
MVVEKRLEAFFRQKTCTSKPRRAGFVESVTASVHAMSHSSPSPTPTASAPASPNTAPSYPGNLTLKVTYRLTADNELIWKTEATTDAPTIINLAHHSYWNLSGDPTVSINGHELMLAADHYLPTNAGLIPTGEIAPVAGTSMDFTSAVLRPGETYTHTMVHRFLTD